MSTPDFATIVKHVLTNYSELNANTGEFTTAENWFNPSWLEFQAVVGSRAYGLSKEATDTEKGSDTDIRGWYLPPVELTLSLHGCPEQKDFMKEGRDEVYHEVKKFITLALKGNPSILEILWSPIVLRETVMAGQLIKIREGFLSKKLRNTHLGYVQQQLSKMGKAPQAPWKNAMHLLRVLIAGTEAFENGQVLVEITDPATLNMLREIRAGHVSLAEFEQLRLEYEEKFKLAVEKNNLPDEPDYLAAEHFLIRCRNYAWNTGRY